MFLLDVVDFFALAPACCRPEPKSPLCSRCRGPAASIAPDSYTGPKRYDPIGSVPADEPRAEPMGFGPGHFRLGRLNEAALVWQGNCLFGKRIAYMRIQSGK
jgi:hypothetical protein